MGSDTMVRYEIESTRRHAKGFTLIASLLLLLLLSGIAIGLMMMVTTESKVGGTDLRNDVAFHSAEGGIEKMASDLSAVFHNAQSPSASEICSVSSLQPSMVGVTWKDYTVAPASGCTGTLTANWGQISAGPNQGLWAQIIPVSMLATAALSGGQEVSMVRNAQVALIPVFQFGVFSESDLSFFSGPDFNMAGPIHTNGDLYPFVGPGSTLTFHNQVSVYGNVVRTQLANGFAPGTSYNGTVDIPNVAGGCTTPAPSSDCVSMSSTFTSGPYGDGSVTGAGSSSTQNTANYTAAWSNNWNNFSTSSASLDTNNMLINGNFGGKGMYAGTGAKKLSMPFVDGTNFPYELIRRPPSGESATSVLGASREYNLAQIRVLLTDDPAELPGGASDANNVRLANIGGATPSNQYGIPITNPVTPTGLAVLASGSTYNMYFAAATDAIPDTSSCTGAACPPNSNISAGTLAVDWPLYPADPAAGARTLVPLKSGSTPGAPVTSYGVPATPPTIVLCPPTTVAPASLPAGCSPTPASYFVVSNSANASIWNLIDGYLRVEYKDVGGNWNPVTNEWLGLGFSRGLTPPVAGTPNPVNPNAILLLQQPADRRGTGALAVVDTAGIAPACLTWNGGHTVCTSWSNPLPPEVLTDSASASPWFGVTTSTTASQSVIKNNWYPINFYDAREGEPRDVGAGNNSCSVNGAMNAVEIDVRNLKKWLAGNIGTSGTNVDYVTQNGYALYFSDRRGMLPSPNAVSTHIANTKSGDSGLEDVVNSSSAAGTPDNALEPVQTGRTLSPEDVNQNGLLDDFGTANLGLGFYNGTTNLNTSITTADNSFLRVNSCSGTARKNWVSGARHVLRLVDGSLGNVPLRTDAAATLASPGGFTLASENPVYILGDYNSNSGDTVWNTPPVDLTGHSSAAVIADAVTFLSNTWSDRASLGIGGDGTVTTPGNRNAADTYYRVAIAGGKNINFSKPSWGGQDFGTDGGVHNFLRYLENWSGQTLRYKGSIVSLYYSTYNTGLYKCCTTVYSPPTRNYGFDMDFATPGGLPPGTPMFRDIESLGYRQLFTARTN
jgi:Tfp pilus assembly protein PilX